MRRREQNNHYAERWRVEYEHGKDHGRLGMPRPLRPPRLDPWLASPYLRGYDAGAAERAEEK